MKVPAYLLAFSLFLFLVLGAQTIPNVPKQPNILYLMSDDMRPELGCYGHSFIKSPNIDALAASGLQFDFAYTNFAYCAPSRNSFLSGRRPDRTRALNFMTTFRERPGGESWTAMPQFFKNKGYFTSSAGKIYHDGMDDPKSWSYPSNQTRWISCQEGDMSDPLGNYCGVTNSSKIKYTDEDLTLEAGLKRLQLAHESGKPWWVSIGVHRPHTRYRVPEGFYGTELYPGDIVKAPKHPQAPKNAPWMSGNWYGGDISDKAHGCPECIIPDDRANNYRRWYYSAVTWADHNLGMALKKLQEYGVEDNTIVVFHADHGYQLGELNEWSKKTNTELAVHIPLIIRVPWKKQSQGKRTKVKAELIDMYKTLADLTGLGEVEEGVQGTSLAPVFDDPTNLPPSLESKKAYSQIPRCGCKFYVEYGVKECDLGVCAHIPQAEFDFMGYSMRTNDWRFTTWVAWDNSTLKVDWSKTAANELYDLRNDTGRNFDAPNYSLNLAGEPQYANLVSQLYEELKASVNTWY